MSSPSPFLPRSLRVRQYVGQNQTCRICRGGNVSPEAARAPTFIWRARPLGEDMTLALLHRCAAATVPSVLPPSTTITSRGWGIRLLCSHCTVASTERSSFKTCFGNEGETLKGEGRSILIKTSFTCSPFIKEIQDSCRGRGYLKHMFKWRLHGYT